MIRYLSWPWVAGLLLILSLALHASLVGQFGSAIPGDLGDPLLNTWILWWNAQRVPFTDAYWNAPSFAPAPHALALSETLLGFTWLTTPLQWLGASPLVAYNVMFVLLPVLNGVSAYWLCLTITRRRDAALVGSLALAFAPYHANQLSHLQNEATFFMPIALVGLHRYWQTGRRRWVAMFGAAMAMNGFVSGYFLLFFGLFVALAVLWLMISRPDVRKLTAVIGALVAAAVALSPVLLKYRSVQSEWGLGRTMTEIERFSADLSSIGLGSPHLALWPINTPPFRPEIAGYPGLAIVLLLIVAVFVAMRDRQADSPPAPRWRTWLVRTLSTLSVLVFVVGVVVVLTGGVSYKVFGIAIDLGILAVIFSARFTTLVRSGSPGGLYATGLIAASMFALGPVGRVFGHRFWYKPPFAWVITAPGFSSARSPALFAAVEIVCLAVLAALAVQRIWPAMTRRSMMAAAAIAAAIVADGWTVIPIVAVPPPLSVPVTADLVVELPTRGWVEDVAAMYRGMTHHRPVVNGYSGFNPPHYVQLQEDLRRDCVNSLEGLRGGRSMDAVIWRSHPSAEAIDADLRKTWRDAVREETPAAIVYRQPRSSPPPDGQNLHRCQ